MYLKLLCSFRYFSDLKFKILHALISIRATELKVKVTKFNGTAKLLRTCETGHVYHLGYPGHLGHFCPGQAGLICFINIVV